MQNQRMFLLMALLFVSFFMIQTWFNDQKGSNPSSNEVGISTQADSSSERVSIPGNTREDKSKAIHINNNTFGLTISSENGDITKAQLLKFNENLVDKNSGEQSEPVTLINNNSSHPYSAKTYITIDGKTSNTQYREHSRTESNGDEVISLVGQSNGIELIKTYEFSEDNYQIGVSYKLKNTSGKAHDVIFTTAISRKPEEKKRKFVGSFNGIAYSTQDEAYEKTQFKKLSGTKVLAQNITSGWVAVIDHYFLTAWIPNLQTSDSQSLFSSMINSNNRSMKGIAEKRSVVTLAAGETKDVTLGKFYIGPAETDRLAAAARHLDMAVDYGVFWLLCVGIFWWMSTIFSVVGNWGWSIILVTLTIKLILFPLSSMSFRSMARMREMQPKMEELKKRFADDKAKLQAATMDLYKREKINPMGGCLPVLFQIPIFMALYWTLMESVELRHSPFILWVHDLSAADPFFVLPVIMGISMFLQQKMNPPPSDPMQAKLFLFMPIAFTGISLFFPAGLVLYWFANNVMTILQQWLITRSMKKANNN